MRTLIGLGILVSAFGQQPPTGAAVPGPASTTICAILTEPTRYDQVLVKIRGEYVAGRETTVLQDASCKTVLRTGDHVWPPSISLTGETRLPPGYREDEVSLKAFFAAAAEANPVYRKPRIVVTMTGKIDARKNYTGVVTQNGYWVGNGFGHFNQFAVQLVMMSASDWEITPREESADKPKKP
jgi:hypothetical protein